MTAAAYRVQRRLPFAPEALCQLVGDVETYPAFIPWVQRLDVLSRAAIGEGWRGLARATVGWKGFVERFATHVDCRPEDGAVDVRLAEGPFRSLENRWRFLPDPQAPGGSVVDFWIAYEFRNPLLQAVAAANRQRAAARIIDAFEAEARRRFPAPAGAVRSSDAPD